jgi:prepilin-type processing-associated H-X9-DG protein
MYAEDHDDRLPLARNWANASLNYLESRTVAFNCPSLGQSGAFGHAFYRPAAGLKMSELRDASSFLMLFDSNELGWNAVGHLAQIPSKGRHPDDRSTFAFCDGHAKQLSRRNLFELLRHQAVAP